MGQKLGGAGDRFSNPRRATSRARKVRLLGSPPRGANALRSGRAVRCTSPGCSAGSHGWRSVWSTDTPSRPGTEPWISGAQSSAHRSLHERADLFLFGGGQPLQREGGRPHGAFIEVRLVAEAERRVPRFELLRG